MPLTVDPPQPPTADQFAPTLDTNRLPSASFPLHPPSSNSRSSSPVPPEFSPITPKVQPVLPAIITTRPSIAEQSTVVDSSTDPTTQDGAIASAPPDFVQEPPPQPFSSDESTDGLALRAAISSLQFQKQKAQEDIHALHELRKLALAEPERFTEELVAGRLKEKRHEFGGVQDVLDAREGKQEEASDPTSKSAGVRSDTDDDADVHGASENQLTGSAAVDSDDARLTPEAPPSFASIPGPQSVVRMPHIAWDKYHVVGEPLEALHDQQRRWPGSTPFQQNRGREFAVTAPYSPFHDTFDAQSGHQRNSSDGSRKDSKTPSTAAGTPTVAEHPYETRRTSKNQAQLQ